tara:strand:+ start:201 stop:926 length:726 start_codon:yes stop_codon:yes gene_type:complete
MKSIIGGVGDFLQAVDSAKLESQIRVYTHQSCGEDFFSALGIDAEVIVFNSLDELNSDYRMTYDTPLDRHVFQSFTLPRQSLEIINDFKKNKDKLIGIHPVGSNFSNKHWGEQGMPIKKMPVEFVKEVIESNDDNEYLIFGKEDELEEYKGQINARYVDYPLIWDSLAHVTLCDQIIAIDSSIKSMALVKKIPSIVLVGDYEDEFRDQMFFEPYETYGLLTKIKFSSLTGEHLSQIKNMMV